MRAPLKTALASWAPSINIIIIIIIIILLIFEAALRYRALPGAHDGLLALQKNSTSISQEKFTGYYREFKGK